MTNSVRADGLHKFVLCQSRFDVGADRFLRLNPPGTSIAQAKNPNRRVIKVWRMKLLVECGDELIIDKRETAKRKDMRMIQGVNINHIEFIPVDDMIPQGFPQFRPRSLYGTPAHTFPACTGSLEDRKYFVYFDVVNHSGFRNQPYFYCWCVLHLETLPFPQELSYLGFSGTSKATIATLIEYRNPLYFPNKKMWKPQ